MTRYDAKTSLRTEEGDREGLVSRLGEGLVSRLPTHAFNCQRAQLRTEEGEGLVSRLVVTSYRALIL